MDSASPRALVSSSWVISELLALLGLVHAVLQLLDLAVEVLAFNLKPLLGGLGLVQLDIDRMNKIS